MRAFPFISCIDLTNQVSLKVFSYWCCLRTCRKNGCLLTDIKIAGFVKDWTFDPNYQSLQQSMPKRRWIESPFDCLSLTRNYNYNIAPSSTGAMSLIMPLYACFMSRNCFRTLKLPLVLLTVFVFDINCLNCSEFKSMLSNLEAVIRVGRAGNKKGDGWNLSETGELMCAQEHSICFLCMVRWMWQQLLSCSHGLNNRTSQQSHHLVAFSPVHGCLFYPSNMCALCTYCMYMF